MAANIYALARGQRPLIQGFGFSMRQLQLIAKNMTVILLSEIVGYGLQVAVTVLVARCLGAEEFGKYSFVLAFVWLFQLLADSGLSNILVREICIRKEALEHQLGATKSLMWMLSILVFALIVLTANVINLEATQRHAIYIMGLAVIATVHAVGYSSIFRAMEEMEYNAAGFVFHKILLLILTICAIRIRPGIIEITTANLLCNLCLWLFYYLIVRYKYHRPRIIVDLPAWRYLIREAIPIGIASVLRRISLQVDVLILTAIASTAAVGLFSASYRIIQTLSPLPETLTIALFPYFSRLAKCSYRELFEAYEKNLKFVYLLSVPAVVVLAVLSKEVILLTFGIGYADAHRALQILSVNIIFLFQTSQFVYLFSAMGKQRLFTISSIAGLGVNIILDFLLIPKFDFIGACIGTLVAEVSLFAMGVCFIKATNRDISFMRASWKSLASGVLMAVILYQFRGSSLSWAMLGILASTAAYALSIMALKLFSAGEISTMRESIMFFKRKSCPVPSLQSGEAKG
jgi:O-antigen/teichoic acid export membrane protein